MMQGVSTRAFALAVSLIMAAATIHYVVSKNRDYLMELPALPCTVLSSKEAVRLFEASGS